MHYTTKRFWKCYATLPADIQQIADQNYAIDDEVAVLFEGQQIVEVVASRPTAKAYQIKRSDNGQVIEEPIETRYLG
ncbi:hypothetical protein [Chamaesiphon sp.]|uniref:hypothetical protein n=1 Tax=Chamaesiphon sp. TaxID=2814140 RepID=UPI003593A9C2